MELSEERAKAVVEYLKFKGVDPSRLVVNYFGSEKPLTENGSAEGRAQNRRVEFAVLEKKFVQVD